jgi:hypothetical protein
LQPLKNGILAQLVEQRTENPCVPGSIPGDTTKLSRNSFINNDLRVFWFLELLQRLLGRYKKIIVNWLYCVLKVRLLETKVTF